jgi:hypothetical protein
MTKETIKTFEMGDHLSDQECKDLYRFFLKLEADLALMGERYALARLPISINLNTVDSYLRCRGFVPEEI